MHVSNKSYLFSSETIHKDGKHQAQEKEEGNYWSKRTQQ